MKLNHDSKFDQSINVPKPFLCIFFYSKQSRQHFREKQTDQHNKRDKCPDHVYSGRTNDQHLEDVYFDVLYVRFRSYSDPMI